MKKPSKVIFSSVSPAKSVSEYAIAINTVSPGASDSPALSFGKPVINSLSPESSLSPASVEFTDGTRADISSENLSVLGKSDLDAIKRISNMDMDSLITSQLLTSEEIMEIDAAMLLSIKLSVIAELFSNSEIRKILRNRIDGVIGKD